MKFCNCVICILALCVASCSMRSNVSTDTKEPNPESMPDSISEKIVDIFGTSIHVDQETAIRELSKAGILHVDTIYKKDGEFENAIIEFAGVKFGMNKGFIFLTSRQDKQAIDSLVAKISRYYGEPSIEDNGEPEWNYYHWNLYDTLPDRPYIRIRPIHSEEGGLMMIWRFND